jgi:hypothetical protein
MKALPEPAGGYETSRPKMMKTSAPEAASTVFKQTAACSASTWLQLNRPPQILIAARRPESKLFTFRQERAHTGRSPSRHGNCLWSVCSAQQRQTGYEDAVPENSFAPRGKTFDKELMNG